MKQSSHDSASHAFVKVIVLAATSALIGCASQQRPPASVASGSNRSAGADRQFVGNRKVERNVGKVETGEVSSDDDINDDLDVAEPTRRTQPHPFDSISDASLRAAFEKHPETLGSISIGKPNAGQLINGIRPSESPLYHLTDPANAWGTAETVQAVCHVLEVVAKTHPDTPVVDIGDISAKYGGPLRPHHSHQSGRDVDLGLYYRQAGTRWYTRATRDTLDVQRTWTLIRSLVTDTPIELILLDHSLQQAVEAYAVSIERDPEWVHSLFKGDGTKPALIRHSPGHSTHLHLRFFSPIAQESARRLIPYMRAHHWVRATALIHVAISGDTLAKLAQRYHTTMSAIRRANRMPGYQLVVGRHYAIPALEPTTPGPAPRRTSESKL